ncbi:hypothetical protein K1X84_07170 [bacterium]|nr:hypothetical protein [bacterium]
MSLALFDKIVETVYAQLEMKLSSSKTHRSYYELTKDTDEVIRKIFQMRYEDIFLQEKQRIGSAPVHASLNYASEPLSKSLTSLIDDHKKNFLISKDEVEKAVKETLFLRIRYIVMPLATLEDVLFSTSATRPVNEIIVKMREFEKYRYYTDALEKYAQAKSIAYLTKGQFRLLLTEINQSLFSRDGLENVLKVSGLIMKELNDLQARTSNSIEIDILMKAFEDRSLRDFEVALNIEKELGSDQINLYGLRQVLNRFTILKANKAVPELPKPYDASVKTVETKPKDTTGVIINETLKKDESGELIDIKEILEKKNQPKESTDSHKKQILQTGASDQSGETAVRSTGAPLTIEPADVTGEFIKEELVESFSDDTSAIKLSALKESDRLVLMESLINEKDEKIILKSIFNDDREDYREFMHGVNRSKTWKEAIGVLDDKLVANKVDPYSKEAIRLSDIVYTRYYPPEQNN